jgi:hypothetical protein
MGPTAIIAYTDGSGDTILSLGSLPSLEVAPPGRRKDDVGGRGRWLGVGSEGDGGLGKATAGGDVDPWLVRRILYIGCNFLDI